MPRRDRPVLVYDGDCGFCTSSARFIERRVPTSAKIAAFQLADLDGLGVSAERASREVLWVDRDGRVSGGASAVAALLLDTGGMWWVLGAIIWVPPVRWVARGVYRLIAGHRDRMPGGTPACALPADRRPGAAPRA